MIHEGWASEHSIAHCGLLGTNYTRKKLVWPKLPTSLLNCMHHAGATAKLTLKEKLQNCFSTVPSLGCANFGISSAIILKDNRTCAKTEPDSITVPDMVKAPRSFTNNIDSSDLHSGAMTKSQRPTKIST